MIRNDIGGYAGFYNNPFLNNNLYVANTNTYKGTDEESVPGKEKETKDKKIQDYIENSYFEAKGVYEKDIFEKDYGFKLLSGGHFELNPHLKGDYLEKMKLFINYSVAAPGPTRNQVDQKDIIDNKPVAGVDGSFQIGLFNDIFGIKAGMLGITTNLNNNGLDIHNDVYYRYGDENVINSLVFSGTGGFPGGNDSVLGAAVDINIPGIKNLAIGFSYSENPAIDNAASLGGDNYMFGSYARGLFSIDKNNFLSFWADMYAGEVKDPDEEDITYVNSTVVGGVAFQHKTKDWSAGFSINGGYDGAKNGEKTYEEDVNIYKNYGVGGTIFAKLFLGKWVLGLRGEHNFRKYKIIDKISKYYTSGLKAEIGRKFDNNGSLFVNTGMDINYGDIDNKDKKTIYNGEVGYRYKIW